MVDGCAFLSPTVLFKTPPSQSPSLQALARCVTAGYQLTSIVWDNSPRRAELAELRWLATTLPGSVYRHTPDNLALSRIHNTVIDEYLRPDSSRFAALLITDQDSIFQLDFLGEVAAAIAAHPDVSLFLPHVVSSNRIVSPANVYGCIRLPWRNNGVGRIPARGRMAITSGMIVRSEYLARRFSGYDERLRFTERTTNFCREYARTERA